MLKHLLSIIALLVTTSTCIAEDDSSKLTNVGFAPFNLTSPNFNCSGFFRSISTLEELHIAFLYNTFGNDFSCLNVLLQDPRLKTLEVNLINEPGHRNNRLRSYEFLYGVGTVNDYNRKLLRRDRRLKIKFEKYVRPMQNLLSRNLRPHTSLLINPGLESNLTPKAGRILIAWTRESFPDARIVWNPFRASLATRTVVNADLVEAHGQYPPLKAPCVYNMDGTDVKYKNRPALGELQGEKNYFHSGRPLFQQMEKYANRCEIALVWTQESNGLRYDKPWKEPRSRNHFISTAMYNQIMADIISLHRRGRVAPPVDSYTDEDNAITSTCDVISSKFEDGSKRGRLLKQSEFPDRGAVLILPQTIGAVSRAILVKQNSIVDRYNSTGTYHDGRKLFRSQTSPTRYPFNTYLVIDSSERRYCYKLPNPRIRLD